MVRLTLTAGVWYAYEMRTDYDGNIHEDELPAISEFVSQQVPLILCDELSYDFIEDLGIDPDTVDTGSIDWAD